MTYNVTLNLSSLNALNPNGPFSLDLQLIPGSGNVANTVTLSSFVFTGGTTTGAATLAGGATGSFASSVVLNSTVGGSFDNEIYQAFTSGVTSISFHADQTPNAEVVGSGTPAPDQFNVAVLDSNLFNILTTDPAGPTGNDTLVNSDLGPNATVNTYTIAAAPEPSSMALSFIVALGMIGMVLRRRSQVAK